MTDNRVGIRLKYENRGEYFTVDGEEIKRDTEELVSILNKGIKTDTIKSGTIIKDKLFTRYVFNTSEETKNNNKPQKNKIVIRVLNKEKHLIKNLSAIESHCVSAIKIGKANMTRLVAGVLIAITIVTLSSTTIVKGLKKVIEGEDAYTEYVLNEHEDLINRNRHYSESELSELNRQYYEDLKKRYEAGDETVKEEYEQYLYEQELKERNEQLIEEEKRENGFIR